jgi:SAM-dependent methyltransferase
MKNLTALTTPNGAPQNHRLMQITQTRYDTILYPSYAHPQTHPDQLAVIGTLHGLKPARANRCRVLELGCGNGSNLVPMAWGLPNSEFIGVDLAAQPIAFGQAMIRDLKLTNVRLQQGDVSEINGDWGKFDYIIAHGLYSWVPAKVQQRVLAICRESLSPQGIAFVSYNALPGGHLRGMLREMMLFHVRGFSEPEERVRQALAFTKFLADAQDSHDEHHFWMKGELERILGHAEGHLYHDELAELNEPLYFTQFMERAGQADLQYVGEADYFEMSDHAFKDTVRQTLGQLAQNRILREQYLDFLKCRCFRQTLLCLPEAGLSAKPQARHVAGFLISSPVECTSGNPSVQPGVKCSFVTPKRGSFETDFALGKAALSALSASWPQPFETLVRQCRNHLTREGVVVADEGQSTENLSEFLLQLYSAGIVAFRTELPPFTSTVSERPAASPVVRWQAQRGEFVTSIFHLAVKVEDEIGRQLLTWLDGNHDRNALVDKLWQFLKSQDASTLSGDQELAERRKIESDLEKNLMKLARLGLLAS